MKNLTNVTVLLIFVFFVLICWAMYKDSTFQEHTLNSHEIKIPKEFKDCTIGKGMIDSKIIYLAHCKGANTTTLNEFHQEGKIQKHTTTIVSD